MKKLLYLGLTALMMLFAVGFAKADNAKVKVELNPTTWTIGGETAPQFTVTITAATATEGEETPAAPTLGTAEGNVAVKVTLTNEGTTKEQVITSTPVALTTTDLTAGTWALTYALVKGSDQTTAFDGAAEMDNTASTTSLTINAAAPAITLPMPTFTPADGEVEQGSRIIFNLPEGDVYQSALVAFCYVFDDNTVSPKELKPTFEELTGAMYGEGEDLGYDIAAYYQGQAMSTGIIPLNMTAGSHSMRVRMAFIADMSATTPEVIYSEVETTTYLVKTALPAPQPIFAPVAADTTLVFNGAFSLSLPEGVDAEEEGYLVFYIIDPEENFDFSTYTKESAIKAAGAKTATLGANAARLTKTSTVKAATCKYLEAEDDDSKLFAWSTPVTVTYTVAALINKAAGEYDANTEITIAKGEADSIFVATGKTEADATAFVKSLTDVKVTLTADTVIRAYAMIAGKYSDTVVRAYTIKTTPTPVVRPTVTLSFVTPSSVGGSYAEPDTTYNTVMPEFSVKVEGVTPSYSGTPAVAVHYEIYRFIDGKDSLIEDDHKFNTTFEVGRMDEPFPNDTYKIVISVDERSAERNEDYEWDWTPYNGADGKVAQLTGFFKIAAPAWTLVSPELEVEEDEYGWETILPAKTRENGPRVEIKTENCEGLFGNGEDKMVICKQVSVPSLMKNQVIGGMGGLTGAYTIYDTMIPSDGNIVWTLPIGWVDSVKKAITAEVAAILEEAGDDDEAAAMREYYAFKDVEDLSDCNIMVMAGTLMDMSEYGMEGVMFMPAEDYPSMYIEIPFTVIDTIFVPSFSLEAGEVTVNTDLWITADLATDTIYYRVDEGAFQKAEGINTVSILLDKDMTVSAYAISKTGRMSDTVTAAYTVVEETEESELTVEAVGATKEGENYTFSAAEIAFDMFVKNKVEGDTLTISIYTKTQYDTMGQVEPQKKAVADSVRFETTLEDGEYVGVFAIVRKSDKVGEVVVADETINFSVSAETANESAELAGVNVYPNPNAGAFNVAVPERARVEIFGLNGAMLMSREVNAGVEAFSIDHSGIYFVRVMAGNKTAVKRVIVR